MTPPTITEHLDAVDVYLERIKTESSKRERERFANAARSHVKSARALILDAAWTHARAAS